MYIKVINTLLLEKKSGEVFKKKVMIDENHLSFDLDCSFNCLFAECCLVFDLLSNLKLFKHGLFDCYLCNTILVGFGLIGLLVEFELDDLTLISNTVYFKCSLDGELFGGFFDLDLALGQLVKFLDSHISSV